MGRRNIIAAIVLLALGLAYGLLITGLPLRTLPNTPDPSFFPWINAAILLALAAALLVQGLFFTAGDEEQTEGIPARRQLPVLWVLAAFVAYLIALPPLGFVVATVPFFAALMVAYGERRALWLGAGALGVPILLFVVFRYGFGVLLPRGLLSGLVG
jgi:hypothetical protein